MCTELPDIGHERGSACSAVLSWEPAAMQAEGLEVYTYKGAVTSLDF